MYYRGDTGADRKTFVLASLASRSLDAPAPKRALVVGCGSGKDANAVAIHFDCRVTGIDLEDYFDNKYAERVDFHVMDACALDFPDNSFDFVYSFHALEHIPDYAKAIQEIRRVLRPHGTYCIGTPNRVRIVTAFLGMPDYPLRTKIRSNLQNWGQQLSGQFRNELGAHAGYSGRELLEICQKIGPGREISADYYLGLYSGHQGKLKAATAAGLSQFLYPSVYVLGRKG